MFGDALGLITISAAILVACCCRLAAGAEPVAANLLTTLEARLVAESTAQANPDSAHAFLKSMQPDGTWRDIDYKNRTAGNWAPATHLSRLSTMAAAMRALEDAGKADEALYDGTIKAFDAWLTRDPQGDNWWNNEIGTPQVIGRVAILLRAHMTPAQHDKVVAIVGRARLARTGQNLVWLAQNVAVRGLIQRDEKLVETCFARIWEEVRNDASEGIQPDASFHQHGAQLYVGGYGRGFLTDTTRLMALAAGTSAAAPPAKVRLMEHYLLDCVQWLTCGGMMDPFARGREISRGEIDARPPMRDAAERLLSLEPSRKDELQRILDRLANKPDTALVGNRYYWSSDFMVHRRPGWYASVKMVSERTLGTESGNGENHRCHGQLFGANLVMRSAEEYAGIFPVWDWSRLPGATMEPINDWPKHPWGKNAAGATAFVGGVSDGTAGAAAFDLSRDGIKARKFWALGEHTVVALGAGLQDNGKGALRTSLDQSWLKGMVIAKDSAGVNTMKEPSDVAAANWAIHNQIGYANLGAGKLTVANRTQRGSWRDLNDSGSDKRIERPVFSAWIDHGDEKTYAYAIFPEARPDTIEALIKDIHIIVDTPAAQAVEFENLTAAAFYEAGTVGAGAHAIAVDKPCMVLVRWEPAGPKVAVSNPFNKPLDVTVTAGTRKVTLQLPGGTGAGSSAVRGIRD